MGFSLRIVLFRYPPRISPLGAAVKTILEKTRNPVFFYLAVYGWTLAPRA